MHKYLDLSKHQLLEQKLNFTIEAVWMLLLTWKLE